MGSEHGNPGREGACSEDQSQDVYQLTPEPSAGDRTLPWRNTSIFALEYEVWGAGCVYNKNIRASIPAFYANTFP